MSSNLIIALDFADPAEALAFAARLDPKQCRVKVGKELFVRGGPAVIEGLHDKDFEVFLDLKFHDIPNTVAGACRAAADLGVWMVNVHASGGLTMMEAARESLSAYRHRPLLIAVTVLTSLTDSDLRQLGINTPAADMVTRLAGLTRQAGLDGVVCSAQEAAVLKQQFGNDFQLITPGIRLPDAPGDDQRRTLTPAEASQAGADYLVVGRPVTRAAEPMAVVERIHRDLQVIRPARV